MVSWIRRHRLVTFFVLAYVIAWCAWPLYLTGVLPRLEFQACGPLVAALVVASVADGRAGLRELGARMIRWRVGWQWWAVAFVVPIAVHLATALLASGAIRPTFVWTDVALLFAIRLINPLDGPLGEEPGWRGFALPHMPFSPLASAAVLGVLVAGWHIPLVTVGNLGSWLELATTFSLTIVYAWLFNRTGGSVLLPLVFHAVEGTLQPDSFGAEPSRVTTWYFVVWTVVAVAVVFDRRAWTATPTRQDTATSSTSSI